MESFAQISLPAHPFWWLLAMACVVWYSTITVYVAIRGTADIRNMLRHLGSLRPPRGE